MGEKIMQKNVYVVLNKAMDAKFDEMIFGVFRALSESQVRECVIKDFANKDEMLIKEAESLFDTNFYIEQVTVTELTPA